MCALIKMSGIGVTELSGKFGGSVGSRNKSGAVLRNRVKGTNARTNKQIVQRGSFSATAASWRGLTAAERLAWNMAAQSGEWPYQNRLGESRQPTGSQLFNRLNDNIKLVGGTPITEPPLKVSFTSVVLGALTAAAGTPALSLAFTGVLDTDESMVIDATYGASPGVTNGSNYRKIATYSSTTPANLLAGYQGVFGNPIEGTKIFVRVRMVNEVTGQDIQVGEAVAVVAA